MPLPSKPEPIYEPNTDAPLESLPLPPAMPKRIKLRWINDLRFKEVSDDPGPEYIDTED